MLCLDKQVRGNSDIGMLKVYGLKRDLEVTIPALNEELLIIFLLQQAPRDCLKGRSHKALTQPKIVKKPQLRCCYTSGKRENWESEHLVYPGELEMKFLVLSLYLETRSSSACLT